MQTYQPIMTIAGIPVTANGQSWQFVLPKLLIGLVVTFVFWRSEPMVNNILTGLLYGILLNIILMVHIVGHIISSKFVTPSMSEARITPKLIETRYDNDIKPIAPRVHIIRSIGGPLMNLLLGTISYLIWITTGHHLALFLVGANWVFMIIVLLPFPSVDGGVIWREIFRRRNNTNVK